MDRLRQPWTGDLGLDFLDVVAKGVGPLKNEFDDYPFNGQLAVTHQLQQALQLMGKPVNGHDPKEAGPAFDGMERAENGGNIVCIFRVLLQEEHALLNVIEVFDCLVDKFPEQVPINACVNNGELIDL